jgi:hypothetical protein
VQRLDDAHNKGKAQNEEKKLFSFKRNLSFILEAIDLR